MQPAKLVALTSVCFAQMARSCALLVDRRRAAVAKFHVMKKAKRSQDAVLPTPGELRLLRILWRLGEGSIEDILAAADENPAPNYKTAQSLLRIMERKGQVNHFQKGRAFIFRPLIGQNEVHRLSIRDMMKKYFTGSRTELLVELLRDERILPQELRELENLIRERRKDFSG